MAINTTDNLLQNELINRLTKLEQQMEGLRTLQIAGANAIAPEIYSVVASADLSLTTSFQDIAGMTQTFTPTGTVILLAYAQIHFAGDGSASAGDEARAIFAGSGGITLGSARSHYITYQGANSEHNLTLIRYYAATADTALTIKVQAKNDTGNRGIVNSGATGSEPTYMQIIRVAS